MSETPAVPTMAPVFCQGYCPTHGLMTFVHGQTMGWVCYPCRIEALERIVFATK